MTRILWQWLLLPLLHWLIVGLLIIGLDKLVKARRLAKDAAARAMHLPVNARMAEVTLQVKRADGSEEPPRTYRTYSSPLRRWAWAIRAAFASEPLAKPAGFASCRRQRLRVRCGTLHARCPAVAGSGASRCQQTTCVNKPEAAVDGAETQAPGEGREQTHTLVLQEAQPTTSHRHRRKQWQR